MRRREFITLFGAMASTWSLSVRAQQGAKLPIIGFLGVASASAASQRVAAFSQRLDELGWVDGRTVAMEYRWAEGRAERFAEFAAEFVRLKVDVIVTHATEPVIAAKRATSVIPIVFAVAGDPVGTGLVARLAQFLAGIAAIGEDMAQPWIERADRSEHADRMRAVRRRPTQAPERAGAP